MGRDKQELTDQCLHYAKLLGISDADMLSMSYCDLLAAEEYRRIGGELMQIKGFAQSCLRNYHIG